MAAADLEQMTKDLERQNRALEAALDERRASPQHAAAPVEAEPFSLHPSGQASARDCSPRTQGSWPGEGRSKPEICAADQRPTPGSWLEALHCSGRRLVEPGDVKALANDRGVRGALLASVWFPRDSRLWPHLACAGLDLAVLLITLVTYQLYCGTSLFTVVALGLAQVSFRVGKGSILASVRAKGSPSLSPLAFAPASQLEGVRAQALMQLFPEPIETPRKTVLKMCWLLQHALFLIGGWGFVAWWAWAAQLLCLVLDVLRERIGYGNVSSPTTDIFLRCCDAAICCFKELHVFQVKEAHGVQAVDWEETYKNFDVLCAFADKFGRSWRAYFFVVEFISVPSLCLALLGLFLDVNAFKLQAAGADSSPAGQKQIPILLRAASVALGSVTVYAFVFLIIGSVLTLFHAP